MSDPTYGVQPSGWVGKPLNAILSEVQTDLQSVFGQNIDLDPESGFGQFAGIFGGRLGDLWDLGQAIYSALDPAAAQDAQLDNVCAITGTKRVGASSSMLTATCTGTVGTNVGVNSLIQDPVLGSVWILTASGSIAAVPACVAGATYHVGDRVTNGNSPARVYICRGSTGASGTGPTGTGTGIVDGGATWDYVGDGSGAVDVPAQCNTSGPVAALTGTVTQINTPISGWSGVRNLTDATPGANAESNAALRLRREDELQGGGNAAINAIRAAVEKVTGVTNVTVFQNATDTVNADGMPAHSIEALVQGGADAAVRAAVFAAVAGGIQPYGNNPGTVTDPQGLVQSVAFSRPVDQLIYATVTVYVDSTFPSDGATEIVNAILAYGLTFGTGQDVVASKIGAAFGGRNTDGTPIVQGVQDFTTPLISNNVNPPTGSAKVPITSRQLAVFDSGRIVVNVLPWVP